MQMTIYDAVTVGSKSNCVYPNPVTVTDADTMKQAAAFDHVCAAYKHNYRSIDNFLKADCLPMDCDNDTQTIRRTGSRLLMWRWTFPAWG